jgi:hypothetical protein
MTNSTGSHNPQVLGRIVQRIRTHFIPNLTQLFVDGVTVVDQFALPAHQLFGVKQPVFGGVCDGCRVVISNSFRLSGASHKGEACCQVRSGKALAASKTCHARIPASLRTGVVFDGTHYCREPGSQGVTASTIVIDHVVSPTSQLCLTRLVIRGDHPSPVFLLRSIVVSVTTGAPAYGDGIHPEGRRRQALLFSFGKNSSVRQ